MTITTTILRYAVIFAVKVRRNGSCLKDVWSTVLCVDTTSLADALIT